MKVNKNLKKLSKLRKERLKPNGCKNHHLQEYQEIFSKQLNSFLKNNISDQRIFKQYQKAIDVFFISKVCRQDLNVSKNNFINLKQFILENKNRLKIKNRLSKVILYNKPEEGLFVKSKLGYTKIEPEKYNPNLYYYYEIYSDYIDFYLIDNYSPDNIVVYNDIFSYTSFNYMVDMDIDPNIISISSNEYGTSLISNANNFIEHNLVKDDFETIINNQYKFFTDSNFENLERAIRVSTDVANAFDLNIEQTNIFVAYYLSKIQNTFNKSFKVYDYFCEDKKFTKYISYFDKVNFNYFKYNFNDTLDLNGKNLFYIEKYPFTNNDYNRFCNYLNTNKQTEILDYTTGILIGFEFLKEINDNNAYLNSTFINNKFNLNLNDKELYDFIPNYLLFNNVIKNNNNLNFLEIDDIYKKSFLDFKIPISKYTSKELNSIVISKFVRNKYYLGNCAILSVNSLNYLFNFSTGYYPADAWYLVGNSNESIWRKYEDKPLNVDHLIPGLILGINQGSNYYSYTNFVNPRTYNLPRYYLNKGYYSYTGNTIKVPYTHVVPYIGNLGNQKNVILNAGASQVYAIPLNEYVPSGAAEGSWISRSIIEVLAPAGYYSEEEIERLKKYLISFD